MATSHPQPVTGYPGNAVHRLHTNLFAFTPPRFPQPTASPGPLFLQHLLGNSHCPQGQYFWMKANGKALQPLLCWKPLVLGGPAGTQAAGESWVSLVRRHDSTARLHRPACASTARCRAAQTIPLACSRHPSPWCRAWAAALCQPLPHGACTVGAGAAQLGHELQGHEPQGHCAPQQLWSLRKSRCPAQQPCSSSGERFPHPRAAGSTSRDCDSSSPAARPLSSPLPPRVIAVHVP